MTTASTKTAPTDDHMARWELSRYCDPIYRFSAADENESLFRIPGKAGEAPISAAYSALHRNDLPGALQALADAIEQASQPIPTPDKPTSKHWRVVNEREDLLMACQIAQRLVHSAMKGA